MRLAYVSSLERGRNDAVVAEVARLLQARGLRLVGVVQRNVERPGRTDCDMRLALLPDGEATSITQDLGNAAEGCRLDAGALELAVAEVARRLAADGAEVLLINKFGKQEAEGRGFRDVIAEALVRGLPVVLGLNPENAGAFLEFTEGAATELPADPASVLDWLSLGTASAA